MAGSHVVTPDSSQDKSSHFYVVSWINRLLKTNFKDVREMGSGACQCQMMDCTFPGSVDLTKVKFDAQSKKDFKHNFSLLQDAFTQKGVTKTIPVEGLIQASFKTSYEFMKWFKVFHSSNAKSNNDYDPVKARNGKDIAPLSTGLESENSEEETDNAQSGTKTDSYTEEWKKDYEWAERSTLGEQHTYCSICHCNLVTFRKGIAELQRHMVTNKHKKRARLLQSSQRKSQVDEPFPCSDAAVCFIYNRCYTGSAKGEQVSRHFARCKLGLKHPKDLATVSKHTPYCLYIYEGLRAGMDNAVTVVLLGFFDSKSSVRRIRFLDALQSVDGAGDQTAAAVVKTLKTLELSTDNLAVCYNADSQSSKKICSHLRELNPNIIALGGLYNVADAAYHAGIQELSSQVQELMVDLFAHYSSCSTKNDNLKAVFGSDITKKSHPFYLSISCLRFYQLVTKMLEIWSDLILYFSSCAKGDEKAKSLCSQLKDPKVKATFMLLKRALKPLEKFQRKLQESSLASMPLILEEAGTLLSTFTSRFLQHSAAARYLKERDPQILRNKKSHLSGQDLNLGGNAVEEFLQTEEAAEALTQLQEELLPLYIAVTGCIAEELPLSDTVLRNIAQLLNPQSSLKVTKAAVEELGSKLGVCSSPEEVRQLKTEFSEYHLAEERKRKEAANESTLENHWARVLEGTEPSSVLRKLVLTLLSFPCPPLDAQHVLSQALDNIDDRPFSESENLTESESEITSDRLPTINGSKKDLQVYSKGLNGFNLKPCVVRLTKINGLCDGMSLVNGSLSHEGVWRGGPNREGSLRKRPQARKVFQAGVGTWSKPIVLGQEAADEVLDGTSPSSKSTRSRAQPGQYQDGKGFSVGQLVWGELSGMSMWPGLVVPWKSKHATPLMRMVEWFGDGTIAEVSAEKLKPFSSFTLCFCKNSFASLPNYKEAIYQICELAAERCGKSFAKAQGDKDQELKMMVEWASEGFLPTGPTGFAPPDSSPDQDLNDSPCSDYQPPAKRKYASKNRASGSYSTSNRESLHEKLKNKNKTLEDFCLCCASPEIDVQHPLFEGGLCLKCKENFIETLYRYDDDGYQSYCTICCAGLEVLLCGNTSCCRCFCKDCLDILVAEGTFDKLKDIDPWRCYMCEPSTCDGHLKLRPDWSVKVQDLFTNNSAMAFEPHRVYPSIPADQRKPLKVLSLFDGIATGYLVLRDLGFKIERYIASEICDDSIVVGMIKHAGKIEYVNDVRAITRKHLAEWGPFDLLIGGSPCNDLATVNPLRKGLYEGTGRLFFEYYRILTLLKPREEDNRPFFWLFENVVLMNSRDKNDICRFLECNPVLVDAVKVSPAHRARYFWGNIPGMSRPPATSLEDKVSLQDCLEVGRTAKYEKVRTITTKTNSTRQGKLMPLPVSMNGKEDQLWCTEMEHNISAACRYTLWMRSDFGEFNCLLQELRMDEVRFQLYFCLSRAQFYDLLGRIGAQISYQDTNYRIFGFPKHYTDVNNMSRMQRQKVLGRSWSVPVIRHLLAPLKDYFACE